MEKMNRKNGPGQKGPRNTVTLHLDGSLEDFVRRYTLCQHHYRYWILCNSAFRFRYKNRLIYTTPMEGTFYYVLRHEEDLATLVIDGRQGWLVGFITSRGMFQMKFEDLLDRYMDSSHSTLLHFFGNHSMISPDGTGETILSLYFLRKCVHILCTYSGPTRHSEPPGFRRSIGLNVILLLEAKFREIYERICEKMEQPFEEILGNDWVKLLITNWSAISQQIMMFLSIADYCPHNCGIDELVLVEDLLECVFYLHLDAYNDGVFTHTPLDPAPRRLIWAPIDPGLGDGDIPRPHEPESPGVILCRKRVLCDLPSTSIDSSGKRRKGLVGGGLGGAPSAPECFVQWTQKDNEQECDSIIDHLRKDLDLEVKDVEHNPVTAPKYLLPKQDKGDTLQVKDTGAEHDGVTKPEDLQKFGLKQERTDATVPSEGPLASDLACLREPGFLSSELIAFIFRSLASSANTDEVLFVAPTISYLLGNAVSVDTVATQVEQLDLDARSMVLFPINNNEDPSNADGRTHWSLLVLDQRVPGLRRFTHVDSFGGMNFPFVQRLIERLTPLSESEVMVLEHQGAQQDNGYDCAVFLIATAKEICRWWISNSNEDWEMSVSREVNPTSVAALRVDLLQKLERYLTKKAQ